MASRFLPLSPRIGLSDEEQVTFSSNLGEIMPQGAPRPAAT
jgi:hypothetical protein